MLLDQAKDELRFSSSNSGVMSEEGRFARARLPLLLALASAFLLGATALEGVVRYYASVYGVPWAAYLPKVLAWVAIGYYSITRGLKALDSSVRFSFVVLIVLASIWGYLTSLNMQQVAFAAFAFTGFFLGAICGAYTSALTPRIWRSITIIFIVSVIGVYIDKYVRFPWTGYEFEIAGEARSAGRLTSMFGQERAAGFGREWMSVAPMIAFSSLVCIAGIKSRVFRVTVWALALYAIFITTAKMMLAAYAAVGILLMVPSRFFKLFWRLGLSAVAMLGVVLPFSAIFLGFTGGEQLIRVSRFLHSLQDRMEYTWPTLYTLLTAKGNLLLGTGLGGSGTAWRYYVTDVPAADNVWLSTFAVFGGLGLVVLLWALIQLLFRMPVRSEYERLVATVGFLVFCAGITDALYESVYGGFALSFFVSAGVAILARNEMLPLPARVLNLESSSTPSSRFKNLLT